MKKLHSEKLGKDFWLAATILPSFQGLPVYSYEEITWLKENPQTEEGFRRLYAAKRCKMIHARDFFSLLNSENDNKRDLSETARNCLTEIYRILGRGGDDGTDELPADSGQRRRKLLA